MAVDVFADTRSRIRTLLQDAAGTYWTDAELDTWINDAQTDYALRTKSLIKSQPIINLENSEIYDFPEDYLDFVRMTDKDGNEIDLTNWKWLRDQYGENFTTHTTTDSLPMYAYTDLTPPGKFRFYPTPDPTVEASMTAFQDESSPYFLNSFTNTDFWIRYKYCNYKDGVVFVNDLDEVWYWVYGRNPKRLATGMNGILSAGTVYVWVINPVTGNVSKMSETMAAVTAVGPVVAVPNDIPMIYAVDINDSTEILIACSATQTFRIAMTDAGVLTSGEITFDAASLGLCGFSYNSASETIQNVRFDVKVGGLHRTYNTHLSTLAAAGNLTVSTLIPDNALWDIVIDKNLNYYYLQKTGTIFSLYKNNALYLSLAGYLYATASAPIRVNTFFYDSTMDMLYITAYNNAGETDSAVVSVNLITGAIATVFPPSGHLYDIINFWYVKKGDVAYNLSGPVVTTAKDFIGAITPDEGELVYVDDESFVSDDGIITDIVDTSDTALFDGQEGAVVQVIDTDEACTLWYARYPAADILEFTNTLPLVYYTVMQAYLKEADMLNFAKAQIYQQMYQREVDKFNSRQRKPRPILHNQ